MSKRTNERSRRSSSCSTWWMLSPRTRSLLIKQMHSFLREKNRRTNPWSKAQRKTTKQNSSTSFSNKSYSCPKRLRRNSSKNWMKIATSRRIRKLEPPEMAVLWDNIHRSAIWQRNERKSHRKRRPRLDQRVLKTSWFTHNCNDNVGSKRSWPILPIGSFALVDPRQSHHKQRATRDDGDMKVQKVKWEKKKRNKGTILKWNKQIRHLLRRASKRVLTKMYRLHRVMWRLLPTRCPWPVTLARTIFVVSNWFITRLLQAWQILPKTAIQISTSLLLIVIRRPCFYTIMQVLDSKLPIAVQWVPDTKQAQDS